MLVGMGCEISGIGTNTLEIQGVERLRGVSDYVPPDRLEAARGVAVAVNGEVVPRSEWEGFALSDGMRVEVLRAVQGG